MFIARIHFTINCMVLTIISIMIKYDKKHIRSTTCRRHFKVLNERENASTIGTDHLIPSTKISSWVLTRLSYKDITLSL